MQYIEAIECFKVVDKSIKIENCFKELIKLKADNPTIRIDKGDYYFSIDRHDKAMGCYRDALSLSLDDKNWLIISQKINELSKIIGIPVRFGALHQTICKITEQKQSLDDIESNDLLVAGNDSHEVNINGASNNI